MDPVSILSIVGVCLTITARTIGISSDIKTVKKLWKEGYALDEEVNLLLVEVNALSIAAKRIASWLDGDTGHRLAQDERRCLWETLQSCDNGTSRIQEHILNVKNGAESVTYRGRWKHWWAENDLKKYKAVLSGNVQALCFLLQTIQLPDASKRQSILSDEGTHALLEQVKEDSSSIRWIHDDTAGLDDTRSIQDRSSLSEAGSFRHFAFDQVLMQSSVYRSIQYTEPKQRGGQHARNACESSAIHRKAAVSAAEPARPRLIVHMLSASDKAESTACADSASDSSSLPTGVSSSPVGLQIGRSNARRRHLHTNSRSSGMYPMAQGPSECNGDDIAADGSTIGTSNGLDPDHSNLVALLGDHSLGPSPPAVGSSLSSPPVTREPATGDMEHSDDVVETNSNAKECESPRQRNTSASTSAHSPTPLPPISHPRAGPCSHQSTQSISNIPSQLQPQSNGSQPNKPETALNPSDHSLKEDSAPSTNEETSAMALQVSALKASAAQLCHEIAELQDHRTSVQADMQRWFPKTNVDTVRNSMTLDKLRNQLEARRLASARGVEAGRSVARQPVDTLAELQRQRDRAIEEGRNAWETIGDQMREMLHLQERLRNLDIEDARGARGGGTILERGNHSNGMRTLTTLGETRRGQLASKELERRKPTTSPLPVRVVEIA